MADPRYRRAHQQERLRWSYVVDAGEAFCAEVVCLMPNRWIQPGSKWHLLHDTTGTQYLGVGHEKCNASEGARRGNKNRARKPRRWVL